MIKRNTDYKSKDKVVIRIVCEVANWYFANTQIFEQMFNLV